MKPPDNASSLSYKILQMLIYWVPFLEMIAHRKSFDGGNSSRFGRRLLEGCLLLSLVVIAAFLITLARGAVVTPANARLILLYATCTINKDFLQPYNPSVHYTPNLETFAEQSIVFQRHMTQQSFSGGAYASLFTGTYPYKHGIYYHPARLKENSYLMAEAFRDHGYETFFWTLHRLASPELNYAQGVSATNIIRRAPGDSTTLTARDPQFVSILKKLKADPRYRAYVQVNFSITHAPYTKFSSIQQTIAFCRQYQQECRGITETDIDRYSRIYDQHHIELSFRWKQTISALNLGPQDQEKLNRVVRIVYASCINRLDEDFGEMLAAIRKERLEEESLIVFTADHGEILGRDTAPIHWGHGHLEPEVLNVPLIVRLPYRLHRNERFSAVTRSIDIFPSLAGLCGIKIPEKQSLDGFNLSNAIVGVEKPRNLLSFSSNEISHPAVGKDDPNRISVAVRDIDTYYKIDLKPQGIRFYTIAPGSNQWIEFEPHSTHELEMQKKLEEFRQRLIRSYQRSGDESEWNEVQEQLRSLGYLH
jgi:arylsulfatase A-like enzyme